jgi:DNA-binding FadR family transcriptional regulator
MSVPNTRPKVADQVFATLLEAILGGRYAAGEKLPPQRALARDLGVTMTALREALKRLEQMGLIDVRHGDAMRVNDVRERGTLDVLAPLLLRDGRLDPGVLADVLEARTLMLSELGALAAHRRDAEQAQRLRALAEAIAAAPDDAMAQEIDFAWATELAHAAGNLVFVLILNAIRSAYFAHAASLPVTADHLALAPLYARASAAIERGDAADARAAVRSLAEAQRGRVERLVG